MSQGLESEAESIEEEGSVSLSNPEFVDKIERIEVP
jgi:hypothetical protein